MKILISILFALLIGLSTQAQKKEYANFRYTPSLDKPASDVVKATSSLNEIVEVAQPTATPSNNYSYTSTEFPNIELPKYDVKLKAVYLEFNKPKTPYYNKLLIGNNHRISLNYGVPVSVTVR